jgi:hypothetical protein
MHPSYSVIIFTTFSGAGYGLLFLMGLFAAGQWIEPDRWFGFTGFFFAFTMIIIGLLSSRTPGTGLAGLITVEILMAFPRRGVGNNRVCAVYPVCLRLDN